MAQAHSAPQDLRLGLAYWMERVLQEVEKARQDLAPDPVHDLRVAIRRCRSLAEGLQSVDPDRTWNKMRKAGKAVFSRLGELRDVQVLLEWVEKLNSPGHGSARMGADQNRRKSVAGDKIAGALLDLFRLREQALKSDAAGALQTFDSDQWRAWIKILSQRAARVPAGSPTFEYLALERWEQAHALHRQALRNRSKIAFHQLRIGLKKFRYVVENFLPDHHRQWGNDLKELQDLLGEVHDLDVLWSTALKSGIFSDPAARVRWQAIVAEQRAQRIEEYRNKMVGKSSLWPIWRQALPSGERLQEAVLAKLKMWASFLDPDPPHAARVARLALQLYDGMVANGVGIANGAKPRVLLQAAAFTHEVGRARGDKNHHKLSARLIRQTATPLAWAPEEMYMTALIARYHRGAPPLPKHKAFQRLSPEHQRITRELAGILRLVDALDISHDGRVRRLRVEKTPETVVLHAEGYSAGGTAAEKIAAARYLLESAIGLPIVVRGFASART